MNRVLGLLVLVLPALVVAQPVLGPPLVGTTTIVNNSPDDQTDPHVSGDLVAYTSIANGSYEIRYHNLLVGSDLAIPNNGGIDALSDISGNTIAYTHFGDTSIAIYTFDVSTSGPPTELNPQPGSNRDSATIGGNSVAWRDSGFYSSSLETEIVVYDRVSQVATRLTNDQLRDQEPSLSPSGSSIVWTKCATDGTGCNIWSAVQASGAWSSFQLTNADESSHPDTNDTIAVYGSTRNGEADIYWQPIKGGTEQHLALQGEDRNPHIAGNLVSFEHYDSTAGNWDIYLYDLSSNTLYRLTQSTVDEQLNDISLGANGLVRVVWTAPNGSGHEVLAFSFIIPTSSCGGGTVGGAGGDGDSHHDGDEGHHGGDRDRHDDDDGDVCMNPGSRPLLASLVMLREPGKPETASTSFSATAGAKGVLCVWNHEATAGWVSLDGREVVDPGCFHRDEGWISRKVELASSNELDARVAGEPGSGYVVRVYGPEPTCSSTSLASANAAALRIAGLSPQAIRSVPGISGVVVGGIWQGEIASAASGCSSSGGGVVLTGLLALLGLMLSGRPRAVVRVRTRRGR